MRTGSRRGTWGGPLCPAEEFELDPESNGGTLTLTDAAPFGETQETVTNGRG